MAVRRWVLRMKWKRLESERLEKEEAPARPRRGGGSGISPSTLFQFVAMCAGGRQARGALQLRGCAAVARCRGDGCSARGVPGAAAAAAAEASRRVAPIIQSSVTLRACAACRRRLRRRAPAAGRVETGGGGAAGEGGGARGGEDRRGGGSGAGERGDARAGARARDASAGAVLPRSRASHQAPDGCAAVGVADEVGPCAETAGEKRGGRRRRIAEAEAPRHRGGGDHPERTPRDASAEATCRDRALRRLQMAARRWVLRRKWKRLETERLEKEAALEAAKIAEAEASARNRAAVIIQSRLRGAICRARYAHDRAGILHTQFLVRAWLIRRRLRAAVDAAVTHNQRSPRPGQPHVARRPRGSSEKCRSSGVGNLTCGFDAASARFARAVPNASLLSSVEQLQCVVDGDELKLEVEVRKSHPMFSDTVAGKGTAPLDDAYARGNARARVALVDDEVLGRRGFDLAYLVRGGVSSGEGDRSAVTDASRGGPHGRLHDATREARSLELLRRSGEGGSRTNDDGTPSLAGAGRYSDRRSRFEPPRRRLGLGVEMESIQAGTCRRRTRPGLRRRTFRCRERPRRNDEDDVLCFSIPNRRMTRRREAPVRFGKMTPPENTPRAAGDGRHSRDSTARDIPSLLTYDRRIALPSRRPHPSFPVPTTRLRRRTVHERLLSLELARTSRSNRGVLGSEDVFDPLFAGEASLELIGVSASGWKNPAPSLVKVTPHTVGTLSAPRTVLRRDVRNAPRPWPSPAKYLSQKSMEKRTR